MIEYTILVGGEVRCKTTWLPAAIAAWNRATCDWKAAKNGEEVELLSDGRIVSQIRALSGKSLPWPVKNDAETDIRDVAAAVLQLCRAAGVAADDLAAAMTEEGLPTTRSRLKSISTIEPGRQSNTTPAEIVVMCYAAAHKIRGGSSDDA